MLPQSTQTLNLSKTQILLNRTESNFQIRKMFVRHIFLLNVVTYVKSGLWGVSWLCTIMLTFGLVKVFTVSYKTSRWPNSRCIPPKINKENKLYFPQKLEWLENIRENANNKKSRIFKKWSLWWPETIRVWN